MTGRPAPLQIYDRRERALVRIADVLLTPMRWWPRRAMNGPVRRILLMRLERIGDLLMVRDAIRDVHAAWPQATIDLAVGSWNAPIASLFEDVAHVILVDVPWLARGAAGDGWPTLLTKARRWRDARYDLVINFEPDVRSNLLAWLSRAPARIGYASGGGRACLTDASVYDARSHVATNARALVARAASLCGGTAATDATDATPSRLRIPEEARQRTDALLGSAQRPLVGIHSSGGRPSKQWHLDRFAAVGRRLAESRGATVVLTGSAADRAIVDAVKAGLDGVPVVDVGGHVDLLTLSAVLAELDVLVTGDTGPMHLAAAVGTPVVALFGPSNPARYGPNAAIERILRVDLPCSPCGQVRLPPERCRGHVPDCLDHIGVDRVVDAALEILDGAQASRRPERA